MAKTILVVDDEEIVVEICRRKLIEKGYEVLTAGNGQDALDILKKNTPDLILLDIQMPVMNGYTFILEKAKVPQYASIPVIVLTAYAEMEPLLKRYGIKAYILKPLKLQELFDIIQKTVGS